MKWLPVAILLLAGCTQPVLAPPETIVTEGQAYAFTEGLVTYESGAPRYRVPGTEGHASASAWLQEQVRDAGWKLTVQTFTGEDYQQLEAKDGTLAAYQDNCNEADQSQVPELSFTNIIASHDDPTSDVQILLGAHWESKEDASDGGPVLGANDGASGVGVLLSLMHDYAPPGDVTIVFFDGEDGFEDCHPLAGSMYYARTMQTAPGAMILLDMVGDSDARFPRESHSLFSNPDLLSIIWTHGRTHLPDNFIDRQTSVYDDHIPFIQEGVPSVDIIDYGDGFPAYWHTSGDTMDNLDSEFMDAMQRIVQASVQDWFQVQYA